MPEAATSAPRRIRQVHLVGKKIRKLRKERQLTQTELSRRIGIPQSDLSRMERGQYRVSLDTLFKILAELEMGVAEFFGEMAPASFTPRDVRLVREFRGLDAGAQREVEDFIDFKAQRPDETRSQEQ